MSNPTGMHTYSVNLGAGGNQQGAPIPPATHFAKMDVNAFHLYLLAHDAWLARVRHIQHVEHLRSEERKWLREKIVGMKTEDRNGDEHPKGPLWQHLDGSWQDIPAPAGLDQLQSISGGQVRFEYEQKEPHDPILSLHPHQAEKRANKKLVRDARTKAKANAYAAKAQVINESSTVAAKKSQLEAIEKVVSKAPLHRVELAAAKSAAARAKQIKFGSDNLEVDVDATSWNVVTRKKMWSNGVIINHHGPTPGTTSTSAVTVAAQDAHQTRTRGANFGRIAAAVDKKPQSTGPSK